MSLAHQDAGGTLDLTLSVNHLPVLEAELKDLELVEVVQDADNLSAFLIELVAWDADKPALQWLDNSLFVEGAPIAVKMGSGASSAEVLSGMITGLELSFDQDRPPAVTVRGYDMRVLLNLSPHTRAFPKTTDAKAATEIIQDAGLTAEVTDTKLEHPFIQQTNQRDLAFLRNRASLYGFEVTANAKTIRFGPPEEPAEVTLAAAGIRSLHASTSLLDQVDGVIVRGWDPTEQVPIVATAGVTEAVLGAATPPTVLTLQRPVFSQDEADVIATQTLTSKQTRVVQVKVTTLGNPLLAPGSRVSLEDLGVFTGTYTVRVAEHRWTPGDGYLTTLQMSRAET